MDLRHLLASITLVAPALAFAAPPVATPDNRTIPTGVSVTLNVLSNDFDPDGDPIRLDSVGISNPENATITVNADGGITVTPAPGVGNTQAEVVRFSYAIVSGANNDSAQGLVTITVVPSSISNTVGKRRINELNVSQALDKICGNLAIDSGISDAPAGRRLLAARCAELVALTDSPDAAAEAVQQISPEETLTLRQLSNNASQLQADMVSTRLSSLGQGVNHAASSRLGWSSRVLGAAAGDEQIQSNWGVFGSVQLEDADRERSAVEAGFNYSSNAATLGLDYALTSRWFAGLAAGLTQNDLDFLNNDGSVKADVTTFIGFTSYNFDKTTIDFQLGLSSSNIDISRHIQYTTLQNSGLSYNTKGQTAGEETFASLQYQYMWNHKALTLYPRLSLNYSSSNVEGYADNGAGGWEVVLGEQQIDRSSWEAGLQATYAINFNWGVLMPMIEVNAIGDMNTKQELTTGSFAYANIDATEFVLESEAPDSQYYQAGLGFSAVFPGGASAFLNLRQTLGFEYFESNQLQAGFRMEF